MNSESNEETFGFTAVNEDGEAMHCTLMFTCRSPWTSGDVIVYTDGSTDEYGNTNIYASKLNPVVFSEGQQDAALDVEPLEEKDWEVVEVILGLMQGLVNAGYDESAIGKIVADSMNSGGIEYARELLHDLQS